MNKCDLEKLQDLRTGVALDGRIEAVLAAMRDAEPENGLEQRILQRLGSEAPVGKGVTWVHRYLRPRFALSAGLALGALCSAILLLHHAALAPAGTEAPKQTVARTDTPLVPTAARVRTGDAVATPRLPDAARVKSERSASAVPVDTMAVEGRGAVPRPERSLEASFPAPAMPLTEQERLLLQIAHRNDPVQVAMLDPVERNLQIARERAESARFFAPPPLPRELREEIHAALRSQYVNTPPPDDETLDQMTNRSTP